MPAWRQLDATAWRFISTMPGTASVSLIRPRSSTASSWAATTGRCRPDLRLLPPVRAGRLDPALGRPAPAARSGAHPRGADGFTGGVDQPARLGPGNRG